MEAVIKKKKFFHGLHCERGSEEELIAEKPGKHQLDQVMKLDLRVLRHSYSHFLARTRCNAEGEHDGVMLLSRSSFPILTTVIES